MQQHFRAEQRKKRREERLRYRKEQLRKKRQTKTQRPPAGKGTIVCWAWFWTWKIFFNFFLNIDHTNLIAWNFGINWK